ncbi:hypothetical protein [Acinetobacter sp.]|uniref:hypothetical protein n=1 Tax=Acinetobacter sp. TaxID=472 RepID=UPI003D04A2DA
MIMTRAVCGKIMETDFPDLDIPADSVMGICPVCAENEVVTVKPMSAFAVQQGLVLATDNKSIIENAEAAMSMAEFIHYLNTLDEMELFMVSEVANDKHYPVLAQTLIEKFNNQR